MAETLTQEPRRADLMPVALLFRCPACDHVEEFGDLTADDSGDHRAQDSERYRHCEGCGAFLDIGWAGWGWHDGAQAQGEG